MKRSQKQIQKEINRLTKIKDNGKMGARRAYDFIAALTECLELDEDSIQSKIEEFIEKDYELYAIYD
jgi:hypothetical protein